ncbi:sialin-like isoform X2 [Lineus longissimus]|uniref:sialin-like isoform X2 n=1 Tax=Lineus longissimus TaxID=88925 RepID=UPI00315D5BA1
MADEEKVETVKVPTFTSCRYILAYVGIVGVLCTYAIRINLSVAIVCMVKPPELNISLPNTTEAGCDFNTERDANATQQEYEFEWSRPLQGAVLSSLFYGYILTQFPGGWLARRFGAKRVLGTGMMIGAVSTLLIPVAARTHVYIVIALRVLVGLGTGVVFPSFHHILSTWAPPLERTKLIAFTYSGTMLGNVVTLFLSGFLCKFGFAGGWPSIFYVFGGSTVIWLVFWAFLVYDSPADHPRISEVERSFIEQSTGRDQDQEGDDNHPIPWLSFVKSIPLWSICVTHIASNWGNYLLLTGLPTYMKDVLKFDMKENGLFSALPYIGMFFMANLVGELVDLVREKGVRTMVVRKVCQTAGKT